MAIRGASQLRWELFELSAVGEDVRQTCVKRA